jgi:hypothetical protein
MEPEEDEWSEMKRELSKKVAIAGEVAASAPQYGERAFDKVLDYLLQQGGRAPAPSGATRRGSREPRGERRAPKVDAALLERVKSILDAPPVLVAEYTDLPRLPVKAQLYELLAMAREKFSVNTLTSTELRAVANEKFRLQMPEGSLRGTLSKAPPTELGRAIGPGGDTEYSLLPPGELFLKTARAKVAASTKPEEVPQ